MEAMKKIAPLGEAERIRMYPLLRIGDFNIRTKILDLVIEPVTQPFFLKSANGKKGTELPISPLAKQHNERFRLEAIYVTLNKSTIEIHSGPANAGVQQWLAGMDFTALGGDTSYKTGFDAVKSLKFPFFSRFPHRKLPKNAKNEDIVLMQRCKNLRSVHITLVDAELTYFYNMDGYLPKALEQMRREYRLDEMLKLKKLERLHLASKLSMYVYEDSGHVGFRQVEKLKEWFDVEFAKRGIKIAVTIC